MGTGRCTYAGRVIDNLLSNAVKYSTSGEHIEVTFTGKATEWMLRVKDYGIGISKAAQRKLFHEFYRSDNAVNAQIVGSGIGLLMTKDIFPFMVERLP